MKKKKKKDLEVPSTLPHTSVNREPFGKHLSPIQFPTTLSSAFPADSHITPTPGFGGGGDYRFFFQLLPPPRLLTQTASSRSRPDHSRKTTLPSPGAWNFASCVLLVTSCSEKQLIVLKNTLMPWNFSPLRRFALSNWFTLYFHWRYNLCMLPKSRIFEKFT